MKVYIGWDSREDIAYQVCKKSILIHNRNIEIYPIKQNYLRGLGVYTRQEDSLASTEFTLTRFLTPFLSDYSGISIFMDCDMLVQVDVEKILMEVDYKDPVTCVQHLPYKPKTNYKMDGKVQSEYPKKNWSSFMVFNCSHPSLKQTLSVKNINSQTPQYLHRMEWATSIGSISHSWNYLVGYYNDIEVPNVLHYTDGGPWFPEYSDCEFSKEWLGVYNSV
jgi:hypothetical protein